MLRPIAYFLTLAILAAPELSSEQAVKIVSPIKFAEYCGHPDHVVKRRGVLMWIYSDAGVIVSFPDFRKAPSPQAILYNRFDRRDVAGHAEFGDSPKMLSAEIASALLGCKHPIISAR